MSDYNTATDTVCKHLYTSDDYWICDSHLATKPNKDTVVLCETAVGRWRQHGPPKRWYPTTTEAALSSETLVS